MEIGAVYPQLELGGDARSFEKFGRAVEQLGYQHLLMYDHVVGAQQSDREPALEGPYTENDPFHDPFVAFAYLAGITTQLQFITGILILPQRQTVLVARQAADLDLLSGERLTLGVGTGWNYVEYDALGQSFAERGRKLDEQIPFLRRLWSEPVVSHSGKYDVIDRASIIPRPKRTIPIYCGGHTEAAFRRGAREADGFIFVAWNYDLAVMPGHERIRELLAEDGRSEREFGVHYLPLPPQSGELSADVVSTALTRWRDAGVTKVTINSMELGFTHVDQHIGFLAGIKRTLDVEGF
jgi:probable F420-dependent oxidoreductase